MPDKHVRDYALRRLEKSSDELETAQICYNSNKYNAAANRAYYSIYHAVRAVLALDKVERSKHSGNISYFREHYIATNIFNRTYSETIKKAEILRNAADYDDMRETSEGEAQDIINKASDFLEAARIHVTKRIESE